MTPPAEHRFDGPVGPLCWFEWGQQGEGPTLLLLHATGFHARCWDKVVAALPPDQHVIALDMRGHGRSYRPASLSDWSATAADVEAFVEACISGPVVGAGHSMGGHVLARAAAALPSRFLRMVLVDPVIMAPEVYAMGVAQPLLDPAEHPVSRRRNAWESAEEMIARFADRDPYSLWDPAVLDDYCRFGLVPSENGMLELGCPPVLEASAYLGAPRCDPFGLLGKVECPVTVVRARNAERASPMDFSISPTWPPLAAQFAKGRDLDWGDLTHFIPMQAPARTAALIEAELAQERG